jgi:hypothetical protein
VHDLAYDRAVVSTFALRISLRSLISLLGIRKFSGLRRPLCHSNLPRIAPWLALAAYENRESERRVEIGRTSLKEQRTPEHGSLVLDGKGVSQVAMESPIILWQY